MSRSCSIIVVTYNSLEHIDACLAGLAQLVTPEPTEIIVVDNASTDDTITLVQTRHPYVRLLPQTENLGFAGGVNRGVEVADGRYIALLNPDAVPQAHWLDQLTAPLRDPTIGVTGSKVLAKEGLLQSVGAVVAMPVLLPSYRGEGERDVSQYDAPVDVWSVHGAAMAFRRELWSALGGFDEGFFPAYLEESDFCERTRQVGLRVLTAPSSVVQHVEATTTGKGSAQFFFYFLRNRLRFAAKWLSSTELWHEFRPAERARLAAAPMMDRRVARLVYDIGVPSLKPPTRAERDAILAIGQRLRAIGQPDDGMESLLALIKDAQRESVHHETQFWSRVPLVAAAKTAWNNIATRWYVRPNLDQQTRYNLAIVRAMTQQIDQMSAHLAASALDAALLNWRLGSSPND